MPSVQYYNNTAPFWDWIASMEDQHHNDAAARGQQSSDNEANERQPNPWTEGWAGFPFGPFPHRPRHHHHHGQQPHSGHPHHRHEGPPAPPVDGDSETDAGPSNERGPADCGNEEPQRPGHGGHGRRGSGGRCDPRMQGGRRGFGGFRGRGGFGGGRGRSHNFHPYAQPMSGPFGAFAQMFQDNLFGEESDNKDKDEDFKPEADVFDTPEAFVVHVSLPGAKKEDVGVNWETEKSELSIAGVTYRPGDEELLKTLAMNERKVGPFERKIRLGSRANPAQVDVDSITARLESGILTVEVPKLDADFVEIKKVDIE